MFCFSYVKGIQKRYLIYRVLCGLYQMKENNMYKKCAIDQMYNAKVIFNWVVFPS